MKCESKDKQKKEISFPRLMKHKTTDCIVLMTGTRENDFSMLTGVALNKDHPNLRNGCDWWDSNQYEDYQGIVVLEND